MTVARSLGLVPGPAARQPRGRVIAVRAEAGQAATLVIRPDRHFPRRHRPGQYLGVGVSLEGRWRWRTYSLTSPPGERPLQVTVKPMPGGAVSPHLARLRPGTLIRLAAPRGDFVIPHPAPAAVLFLTAGSGITPVMGMLRTLLQRNELGDVVHVHCAPTADDVIFGDELRRLAGTQPGYRLILRPTRTQGRLELGSLEEMVPDWRERHSWVCGPAGLLDDAESHWAAAGVIGLLRTERFAATRSAATGPGGTVRFAATGRVVTADGTTSLLDAGEQAGVRMPFGCRMGICHTCMVTLTDGRAVDLRNGAEYEPGTAIQTCVSAPSGDCVVDI